MILQPQKIINVRKYLFTEAEFINITNMPKYRFVQLIRSMTVKDCMDMRYAFQMAQTQYRKRYSHPHYSEEDRMSCMPCQRLWKATVMWMKMEKMARNAYMISKKNALARDYPLWTPVARKIEAKRQWEKFIRMNSY